jgi:hypothetical protein
MRGSYDNTMDVYHGPESVTGPPGVLYRSAVPCRYVAQVEIFQSQYPLNGAHAWVTYDAPEVIGPLVFGTAPDAVNVNLLAADQVVIPSGGVSRWSVDRLEHVIPDHGTPYYRVMLLVLPIPLPPPPPSPPPPPGPGSTCMTAAPIALGVPGTATMPALGPVQWWGPVPVLPGITYYVSITGPLPSLTTTPQVWEGLSCAGLSPAVVTAIHPGCFSFVASGADSVWVVVSPDLVMSHVYTLTLQTVPC